MSARDKTMRITVVVTVVIIISKAVGLVRDAMQASYFGHGIENDAYTVAYGIFYLPILLFSSCITSTMVPLYVQTSHDLSPKRANQFASNVMNVFSLFAMVISLLMYVIAEPLVRITAHKFDDETIALAVKLTRIMMPSLVFVVMSIVISTVLNARGRYVAAQLTGFPLSFAVIFAMVFFAEKYGIDAMGWGVFAASILQVVILVPALRGVHSYSFRFRLRDKRLKKMFILAAPSILSMAVNEINHMIDYTLASGLFEGSVYAMNNSYKLITLIVGVLIVPLTTIMFSQMSVKVTQEGERGIIEIVKRCLEVLAMVLLPVTAIAAVFNFDIVRIVFMRGKFDEQAAIITGSVFMCYVIGVLAFGYRDFLNRAFHSIKDTGTPMLNSLIALGMNIILNLVLRHYMGVNGLALATSISSIVSVVILIYLLRKRVGKMGMKRTVGELLKTGIAGCICAMVCIVLNYYVPQAQSTLYMLLRLAGCSAASLAVYLGVLILLKARQLEFLRGLVSR